MTDDKRDIIPRSIEEYDIKTAEDIQNNIDGAVAFKGNISIFMALCTIIQVCQYGMDFENCLY